MEVNPKFEEIVRKAVEEAFVDEAEASIKEAVLKFEKQLRERCAQYAVNIQRYMSMQVLREDIVITIRIPEDKK
jgi:hypothetical protein